MRWSWYSHRKGRILFSIVLVAIFNSGCKASAIKPMDCPHVELVVTRTPMKED